jgi:hypothetical protein
MLAVRGNMTSISLRNHFMVHIKNFKYRENIFTYSPLDAKKSNMDLSISSEIERILFPVGDGDERLCKQSEHQNHRQTDSM